LCMIRPGSPQSSAEFQRKRNSSLAATR